MRPLLSKVFEIQAPFGKPTPLPSEEIITRAVQFFSTESWRTTSQSPRAATFEGMPPIPWFMLLLTFIGFIFLIVTMFHGRNPSGNR